MSISSSANDRKPVAVTRARESSSSIPITLSEWSSINSYFCRVSMVPTALLENASQLHRPLFVHHTRVTAYNHPRLWLYPSAYISFRLHQFACRNRLHAICAISGKCMDCRTDRRYLCRGSSASRRPSPKRLNDSTAKNIAKPGQNAIHGAWAMKRWAVLSMEPHDGAGGCWPSPKKDRLASAMMAVAIEMVACTISAGRMLGRICFRAMRMGGLPTARAASM